MSVYPFLYPSSGGNHFTMRSVQIGGTQKFMVFDDDLRPKAERAPLTVDTIKKHIHFEPSNLRHIIRVNADGIGRLDRLILLFKTPVMIPSIGKASPFIMLFYTYESMGLTDEQRAVVEGSKRQREDGGAITGGLGCNDANTLGEQDEPSTKKAKNLDGESTRPGRKARDKAIALMKAPDAGISTITPDKRFKMSTVSQMVSDLVSGFLRMSQASSDDESQHAQVSHVQMTPDDSTFIQIVDGSVIQQPGDPLRMYASIEDDVLVVTTRAIINFLGVIHLGDVDYVLLVDPRDQDSQEDEEDEDQEETNDDKDKEIDLNSSDDEGEDLDQGEQVYALFMRARDNLIYKKYVFPGILCLDQLREMLVNAGLAFAGVVAKNDEIENVDLVYLCKNKPQDFEVVDNRIVGSGLDGLQPLSNEFIEENPEDGFDSDEDTVYDESDDELEILESRLNEEEKLVELLKIATDVAMIRDQEPVIEEFKALPKAERTTQKLQSLLTTTGIWHYVEKLWGKQNESNESDSNSDSDDDSDDEVSDDDE